MLNIFSTWKQFSKEREDWSTKKMKMMFKISATDYVSFIINIVYVWWMADDSAELFILRTIDSLAETCQSEGSETSYNDS